MILQKNLPFKLERTTEEITARSGLAIYTEFLNRLGLNTLINDQLPRPGSNRGYQPWHYIKPLLLMLYGGGRHIEDLREIREDKALRTLISLKKFPSPSSVGDWLVRMGNGKGLTGLKQVNWKVVQEILDREQQNEYTLWIDATLIESEKAEAKMSYKGVKGYQPLLAGLKEVPLILEHEFREGNESPGAGNFEFLEKCLAVLPAGKRIKHFSSDSAAYQAEVINLCGEKGITFTIAADQDAAVKALIKQIPQAEWVVFKDKDGEVTDREIAETIHTMNKTKAAFRLIVLRWRNPQLDLFNPNEYCYRAIATNLTGSPSEVVWEYNARGEFENYIKELKNGFGMEQLPSGDLGGNAFWFSLAVLAYNTAVAQKLFLLPPEWWRKTISTLRWSLVETAGKVIRHGRVLVLKLAAGLEKFNLYLEMRRRCQALA